MKCSSDPELPLSRHTRPKFHHRCTIDRLREGSGRPPSFSMSRKVSKDRKSIFKELGLDTDEPRWPHSSEQEFTALTGLASPTSAETDNDRASDDGRSETERQYEPPGQEGQDDDRNEPPQSTSQRPWYSKLKSVRRPRIRTVSSAPPPGLSTLTKLSTIALFIAILLPGFSYFWSREAAASPNIAAAGVVYTSPRHLPETSRILATNRCGTPQEEQACPFLD